MPIGTKTSDAKFYMFGAVYQMIAVPDTKELDPSVMTNVVLHEQVKRVKGEDKKPTIGKWVDAEKSFNDVITKDIPTTEGGTAVSIKEALKAVQFLAKNGYATQDRQIFRYAYRDANGQPPPPPDEKTIGNYPAVERRKRGHVE